MNNHLVSCTSKKREGDDKIEATVTTSEEGSRSFLGVSEEYDQDTLDFIKKYRKTFDSLANK